jgi:hypothetical protein
MADVFTVLSQDHEEVRRMLAELERGPSRATGAGEDQLALRKKMTEQLIIEESRHGSYLSQIYAARDKRRHAGPATVRVVECTLAGAAATVYRLINTITDPAQAGTRRGPGRPVRPAVARVCLPSTYQ